MAMSGPSGGGRDDEESQAFVDINITPLTDVILVLLVIFMVASTAIVESERAGRKKESQEPAPAEQKRRGLPIDLPSSTLAEEVREEATPVLVLTAAGALELEGSPVTRDTIGAALIHVREAKPGPELVLAASGSAPHSEVVSLIEAARTAGFTRVVIGTSGETAPATDAGVP